MRRKFEVLAIISALAVSLLGLLGAAPRQEGGAPPRPFFPDFFSGVATVQGKPAPLGSQLVACINDCQSGYQSAPVKVQAGGNFSSLTVAPQDRALLGGTITFYLVNEFGRIRAAETPVFEASKSFITLTLTFSDPTPTAKPTPTPAPAPPALPMVGDSVVPLIPKVALGLGGTLTMSGALLLLLVYYSPQRRTEVSHRDTETQRQAKLPSPHP